MVIKKRKHISKIHIFVSKGQVSLITLPFSWKKYIKVLTCFLLYITTYQSQ